MRGFFLIALLLAVVGSAAYAQAGTGNPGTGGEPPGGDGSEEGIVRFDVAGVSSKELIVRFAGDSLLLPFIEVCEFLRINNRISAGGDTLYGELPAGQPFLLVRSARTASYRDISRVFPGDAVRIVNGIAYVERSLLEECYGLPLDFDIRTLQVRMQPSVKLPIVAQLRNRRRYEALALERGEQAGEGGISAPITRELLGNIALDWSINMMHQSTSSPGGSGSFRLGAPFLYGVATVSGYGNYVPGNRALSSFSIGTWQWQFSLPEFTPLRRITIGGVNAAGRHTSLLELTNVPLSSRYYFGPHALCGTTQPGWMVELYDRTELVQVAQADAFGQYCFDIALGYLPLTYTVQAVGPHGEIVSGMSRLEVGRDQIPSGTLEYTVRAAADGLSPDAPIWGSGSLRYGVAQWLTIGADAQFRTSSLGSMGLDSIAPTWLAYFWLGGSTHLGVRYDQRWRSLGGELVHILPGETMMRLAVERYVPAGHLLSTSAAVQAPLGRISLGLFSRYQQNESFRLLDATPLVSVFAGGVTFTASSNLLWTGRDTAATGEQPSVPPRRGLMWTLLRMNALLSPDLYLNAGAMINHAGGIVSRADVGASYFLNRNVRLGLGYIVDSLHWEAGRVQTQCAITLFDYSTRLVFNCFTPLENWRNSTLQATLELDLGFGRARNYTTHADGYTSSMSFLDGGLILSPGRVLASNTGVVDRSTIVLRPFHDINANGVRDAGEPDLGILKGVLSHHDMRASSEVGEFYGIAPNEVLLVEIDRWAFADQELFPRRSRFAVYSVASMVHTIDVPFAPGFDVTGECRMILADGRTESETYAAAFNGLRIRLVENDGGAEFLGDVFSDGSIVFTGVSQGEYRIEMEEGELRDRGLRLQLNGAAVRLTSTQRQLPPVLFEPIGSTETDSR